jgi:glycosyltransferase involved in cell wall biosynthesis
MRIGINGLAINRSDYGGGGTYLAHLVKNLLEVDQCNQYYLYVGKRNGISLTGERPNLQVVECPVDTQSRLRRVFFEQFDLPRILQRQCLDILHCPNNVLPLRTPCRTVLTIQYMFSFVMPQDYSPWYRRWYFNNLLRNSARRADRIISVSDDNKGQITQYLGVPRDKVSTIYHGMDESFGETPEPARMKRCLEKYKVDGEYILCVANNVLNKNLEGLVDAFAYLKAKRTIPHRLVIVGNRGFNRVRQAWLAQAERRCPELIHTGYVDHNELPCLYRGASVFVLPSLCESFGIPLLEAMWCGVPVVTSKAYAMPEIVGDAGVTVDPHDCRAIGEALLRVLSDRELRTRLIEQGYRRVRQFSWKRAARETLKVYEEVYHS